MKKPLSLLVITTMLVSAMFLGGCCQTANETTGRRLRAAACPTFHYLLDELVEQADVEALRTRSTHESLQLLQAGQADLVISGRRLKPDEPEFAFEVVGPGYSFISGRGLAIMAVEMGGGRFFTDLAVAEIRERLPRISPERISSVEDVYLYLDEGIIITSVHNTDYARSEMVHVFDENRRRERFSRTPIMYYADSLRESEIKRMSSLLRETESRIWGAAE